MMDKIDLEKMFTQMLVEHERIIYKVCSFYISDGVSMEDLYQEVVCNLWISYPKFRNESKISTWLYRVALNTCISGMRKEFRRPKGIPINLLNETLLESENLDQDIKELYRLIHQLRSLEKAIILLYLEDKSYQEIADITGLSLANVATKLKRTKQKLREMSDTL